MTEPSPHLLELIDLILRGALVLVTGGGVLGLGVFLGVTNNRLKNIESDVDEIKQSWSDAKSHIWNELQELDEGQKALGQRVAKLEERGGVT